MASVKTLARSFAGGEITPEMFGRMDLAAYQTGLKTCRNFRTLPHGPAENRPGFEFVRAVKDGTRRTRLIPFSFNTTQTFAIEVGEGYFRFHTQGATLQPGAVAAWSPATAYTVGDLASQSGVNYYCKVANTNVTVTNTAYWYPMAAGLLEVPSVYAEADLFDLHYVQSSDVLTIVHPNYAPRELRRLSANKWVLSTINFLPTAVAPVGVTATATAGTGTATNIDHFYVVTSIKEDGMEESTASASASCSNDLTLKGAYNTIAWAGNGSIRYNVYKKSNGLYGYIGQTSETTFQDSFITPDVSQTPPEANAPFATDFPAAISYFEQRRAFGGTTAKPQNVWLTRSATESNLSSAIPSRDDDALSFRVYAREANSIRHMVPFADLILLTASAEWKVSSTDAALTPSSLFVRPMTYVGASNVQPATINNSILYAQARGGRIREFIYTQTSSSTFGYINNDISMMAPHLFNYRTIKDLAMARAPYQFLWAVSSDGTLLGLTYVPEQKVAGWHHHDTVNGKFESVCVVTEGDEDILYAIVQRQINGASVRYVERMRSRSFETPADAFFVDCGLTYNGSPIQTVTGLAHLEGQSVAVLADGAVSPRATVVSGSIKLQRAASKIQVGLPITADLETLPVALEMVAAMGQGRPKNVNKTYMRVYRSSGVKAGPTFDRLQEFKQRTNEPYGTPPRMVEQGEIEIPLDNSWSQDGSVCVRQENPLPLTVASLCFDVVIGG